MKLYRFSPIADKAQLLEAIKAAHLGCFRLCKQSLGHYLPIAGNMGIFCHYDEEYERLIAIRKEMAETSNNFNQKYFKLHEPIVIPAEGDVPETTYTYLYIRRPDPYRAQIGDVDFVLSVEEYAKLKESLQSGTKIKGARIFERADLDMVELHDPDIDALAYINVQSMAEAVRVKLSDATNL